MTRPADWTPFMQEQADIRRKLQLAKGVLPKTCRDDAFTETWYAHCWLVAKLEAIQCPLDGILAATQDIGDAQARGMDPWQMSQQILAAFQQAKKGLL